jgi:hypothetical protein
MAYTRRYAGGFVNYDNARQVDDTFLNAVEAALLKLQAVDPTADGQALQWDAANSRFGPALILNKNIDAAAAIDKSKLNLAGQIVDADIAGAAAIAGSKLANVPPAKITGYPTDATKFLNGAGGWTAPPTPSQDIVKLYDSIDAAVALPAASITTPALAQTYKHLRIMWKAEVDAGSPDIYLRVNGDSGANYDSAFGGWNNAVFLNGGNTLNAYKLGVSSAGAQNFGGGGTFDIYHYTDAAQGKVGSGTGAGFTGTGATAIQVIFCGGHWRPAAPAAISTLTFLPSAGNFAAGTRFTVYGLN